MKTTLILLALFVSSAILVGCNSGPAPEPEKPVQGKVETTTLDSVPGDSRAGGEREGDK